MLMTEWSITLHDRFMEMTAFFRSGGEVMIPIAGVSLWMWFLIFRKLIEIYSYKKKELPLREVLSLLCRETNSPGASDDRFSSSLPLKGWQGRLIGEFRERRTNEPETDRKLLMNLIRQQSEKMSKHIPTILILASIAPLLGLLGTVTGMITTFDVISHFGTGNAKAMAGGISEALITTESGLIVAIPGLFMGNFLHRRVRRLHARMERFCLGVCRICEPVHHENTNK